MFNLIYIESKGTKADKMTNSNEQLKNQII